ncbi:MAG: elongation factor 4 [Verrucomicrobia bacterium]|nr:elongation factor 4 [Verrucomicrobiota bacterium]
MDKDKSKTRNFCIIAHVDHGKTTLSDRLLQVTQTIADRDLEEQHLDSMDLERERGITIKMHPVTMRYHADDGQDYIFNLIDTPGHVDFSYEVSRSLNACEGALLIVDAGQGVEAQTVANLHLALKQNLTIIPVINKIDLPQANVEQVKKQLEDILAIPAEEAILASAKQGIGIHEILEAVIKRVPPPKLLPLPNLAALVFDSVFDSYRGVVVYVRVFAGEIKLGSQIKLMMSGHTYDVKEVGVFTPKPMPRPKLGAGDVGYIVANIKSIADVKIGDTVTDAKKPLAKPLPGYAEVHPMVFSGIYPINTADYEALKASMAKLRLNDSSFVYQSESSAALGFGFRCGFLGLLHMEIVQERLQREYNMDIIATYPSVVYRVTLTDGTVKEVDNPANWPDPTYLEKTEEPFIRSFIICPNEMIGDVMSLVAEKRGEVKHTETLDIRRVMMTCALPLNEILVDFVDKLKTITRGYGSMDYEYDGYRESELVKLDMLINGEVMDAFSSVVHRSKSESRGRMLAEKLKEVIPRQLFAVPIQAAIGGKIVARETIGSVGKNVTAKCYGGDISRKRKLLEKQKEGKKRMKQVGKVNIPQEAFITVLKSS